LKRGRGDGSFVVKIMRGISSGLFVGMLYAWLSDIPAKA